MRATYWPLLALVVLGVLTTLTTALPYDMDDDDDADDDLLLPPPRARRVMDSDVISPRDAMTSEDVTSSRDARHADHRQRVADFVREVRRVLSGVRRRKSQTVQLEKRLQRIGKVNKRHCWDVADVCCMWNIC